MSASTRARDVVLDRVENGARLIGSALRVPTSAGSWSDLREGVAEAGALERRVHDSLGTM